jgi:hypothetical protein
VLNGDWNLASSHFPEELKWEALVDVLRGRVKVIVVDPTRFYPTHSTVG